MNLSVQRIYGVFLRYLYLHQRSVSRALELVFWPVMELLVWGFVTQYIKQAAVGELGQVIIFLIGAIIFWDILYRSQQGITISFIEDIWTQNILNVFISPVRIWEWLVATFLYGMCKTLLITVILSVLAFFFYQFNLVGEVGIYLLPFIFNLLFFGWSLGVFTSALLIRWGHAVEALIWGIPFLVQPFSAIYYPLEILPPWLQKISLCLPSTYVFEGMRSVISGNGYSFDFWWKGSLLNLAFFLAACLFFGLMFRWSRRVGTLGRLGMY